MEKYTTLFKLDTKGKLRIWYMERNGNLYRTTSGLDDGKKVTTAWTVATPKNVGKSNETTPEQQAHLEVLAEYEYQQYQGGYSENINDLGSKFFEPMLAKKYEDFIKKPSWPVYSQPKLDGVRCIVTKDGMFSREGKRFVSVPHIYKILKPWFDENPNLVFDGELYNHIFKDNFNTIISLVKKQKPTPYELDESERLVQYHIYDLVDLSNPKENFSERFLTENKFYDDVHINCVVTRLCHNQEELDFEYATHLQSGYEGQMLRIDDVYENKRSKFLFKRKEFVDEEFEVVSISEGIGNWAGYAKSVRCRNGNGNEFDSGIKGSQEFTKELLTRSPKWVTVRYQNLTPDGIPRFPVAVAFFDKKRDI